MERPIEDLLWLSRIESVEGERKDDEIHVVDALVDIRDGLAAAWPERDIERWTYVAITGFWARCHQLRRQSAI